MQGPGEKCKQSAWTPQAAGGEWLQVRPRRVREGTESHHEQWRAPQLWGVKPESPSSCPTLKAGCDDLTPEGVLASPRLCQLLLLLGGDTLHPWQGSSEAHPANLRSHYCAGSWGNVEWQTVQEYYRHGHGESSSPTVNWWRTVKKLHTFGFKFFNWKTPDKTTFTGNLKMQFIAFNEPSNK